MMPTTMRVKILRTRARVKEVERIATYKRRASLRRHGELLVHRIGEHVVGTRTGHVPCRRIGRRQRCTFDHQALGDQCSKPLQSQGPFAEAHQVGVQQWHPEPVVREVHHFAVVRLAARYLAAVAAE